VRVTKEVMRAKLEQLQTYQKASKHVFDSLAEGNQIDFILQSLREGHAVENISKSLDMQATLAPTSQSGFNQTTIPTEGSLQPLQPASSTPAILNAGLNIPLTLYSNQVPQQLQNVGEHEYQSYHGESSYQAHSQDAYTYLMSVSAFPWQF
jgi:hypothetical protein